MKVQVSNNEWLPPILKTSLRRIFMNNYKADGQTFHVCVACIVLDKEDQLIHDLEQIWKFHSSNKGNKGPRYKMVAWKVGETTFECPELIPSDNLATCAECATQKRFLNAISWGIVKSNGNIAWKVTEATDMGQLLKFDKFLDKGFNCAPTAVYKRIQCHMVCIVKQDGRHKARLVAGGHLTNPKTLKECTLVLYTSVEYG
jgi:hypothetical protein